MCPIKSVLCVTLIMLICHDWTTAYSTFPFGSQDSPYVDLIRMVLKKNANQGGPGPKPIDRGETHFVSGPKTEPKGLKANPKKKEVYAFKLDKRILDILFQMDLLKSNNDSDLDVE